MARIKLNLLPEQHIYLEHLIKEMTYYFAWYQAEMDSKGKTSRAERYWTEFRKYEDLLKDEFGIERL